MTQTAQPTPEFLTVRELAALLRIKERKVYELASSGEVPVARVTGKLLFPEREIRAWIAGGSQEGDTGSAVRRPTIFLGSHDPLLEWALRQSRCGIATRFDGSLDGLARFADAEGMATGLHIRDEDGGDWNIGAAKDAVAGRNAVLVAFARRSRGLVIRQPDAEGIRSVADLRGRVVVPRQPESGSQALFERLLSEAGLSSEDVALAETAPSETDAALAVMQGTADAAFGLEAFTRPYGLCFVPIVEERFDLLVNRQDWFDPPFQKFLAFCRSPAFLAHAADLAGYDISDLGTVRWNA